MMKPADLQRLFMAVRAGETSAFDQATLSACSPALLQDLVAEAYSAGQGALARQVRQALPQPWASGQWGLWLEWAVRGNQPEEVARLLREATPAPAWALGALTQAVRLERTECVEQILPHVESQWLLTGPYQQAVAHGDRSLMARLRHLADPNLAGRQVAEPQTLLSAIRHGQVELALEHLANHGTPDSDTALLAAIQGQRMTLIETLIPLAQLENLALFDEALMWPEVMTRLVQQKRSGMVGRLRQVADTVLKTTTRTAPDDISPEAWITLLQGAQASPLTHPVSLVIRERKLGHLVVPTLQWAQAVQPGHANAELDLQAAAEMGNLAAFAFLADLPNMPYDWKDKVFLQAAQASFSDLVDERLDDQATRWWGELAWAAMEILLPIQPPARQARWLGRLHAAYEAYATRENKPLHPEWLALHRQLALAERPASATPRPRRRA